MLFFVEACVNSSVAFRFAARELPSVAASARVKVLASPVALQDVADSLRYVRTFLVHPFVCECLLGLRVHKNGVSIGIAGCCPIGRGRNFVVLKRAANREARPERAPW